MGKPKTESEISDIQSCFCKYVEQVVHNGKVISKKPEVWRTMALKMNTSMTPLALYTAATKNYFNLWQILNISTKNVTEHMEKVNEDLGKEEVSEEVDSDSDEGREEIFSFDFVLPYSEFIKFNPHEANYKNKDQRNINSSCTRAYYVFGKRLWTHLIHEKIDPILKSNGYKCTFMYKRAKIYPTSIRMYASFHGKCKECNAALLGELENVPTSDKDGVIKFKIKDVTASMHYSAIKRPLSVVRRAALARYLQETNIAPTEFRRREAHRCTLTYRQQMF